MAQRFRFRNIHAKSIAKWEDILPLGGTTDGFIVSGNSKFIAFTLQGGMGSTLGVLNYEQAGRVKQTTQIRAHTAHITDFKFLPYEENHVITASQDSTIKIWHVEDANNKDIETPVTTLNGHNLKVNLIAPHHAARGILASSSNDKTVKVWDSLEGKDVFTINQGTSNALSLEWSHDGNILGTTWADKQVRIIDPRQQTFVREFGAHQSTRAQKFAWLGNTGQFVTTGFDQVQKRQIFLWDIRNTSKHQEVAGCPQGQGVLHPYYDSDLGILYLNGKGESLIRFFEHQNGTLTTHLNDVMSGDTTKGYGFVPKYTYDTSKNEVCRVIKLCSKYAEALSIVYPRKTNDFADDLYPNCAGQYSSESAQWVSGKTISPQLISMKDKSLAGSSTISQNFPITEPIIKQVEQPVVVKPTPIVPQQPSAVTQPITSAPAQPQEDNKQLSHPSTSLASPAVAQDNSTSPRPTESNSRQTQEVSQLKEEVAQKESQIESLMSDLTEKDDLIAQLQNQIAQIQSQAEQSVLQQSQFEKELLLKDEELNNQKQQIEQVQAQNVQIQNELQTELSNKQIALQEQQQIRMQLEASQTEFNQLQLENEELKQAITALQNVQPQASEEHNHYYEQQEQQEHQYDQQTPSNNDWDQIQS